MKLSIVSINTVTREIGYKFDEIDMVYSAFVPGDEKLTRDLIAKTVSETASAISPVEPQDISGDVLGLLGDDFEFSLEVV